MYTRKKSKLSKENYRPISIFPNISKVYKRCLYDQISKYFEIRFSKLQSSFCKGYNAKHCLLAMIEKWKTAFDNGGVFAALLTDLSKVCDCIPHDLITDRLVAYDFDSNALKLIHNYLSNRKQRVKVNSAHSLWKDILWCSTRFHTGTFAFQYKFMWTVLFPRKHWHRKLCK